MLFVLCCLWCAVCMLCLMLVGQHRLELLPLRLAELLAGELDVKAQPQVAFGPRLAAGEACRQAQGAGGRQWRAQGACVLQKQLRSPGRGR